MLVEIGLMQHLSVFLGHPAYALGILLFSIIASTGCGSYWSEKLPLDRKPWIFIFPVLTAIAILITRFGLIWALRGMVTGSMLTKIVISVLSIFPMGIFMGFFFPIGMRLVRREADDQTPWYWALNGVFGVLCSVLAVFFAIFFGISLNFYLGFACYFLTLPCLYRVCQRCEVSS